MSRRLSGIALLLLWGCCSVLYVYAGGFVPAFLVYALGALLAGSVLVPLVCVRGVEVERFIERPICMSGDSVSIHVRIRFWSPLPVPWLLIRERWTFQPTAAFAAEYSRLLFPWGIREISFAYTLGPVPRGRHDVQPMELQSGDLFGFVSFRRVVKTGLQLLVYPKPASVWLRSAGRIVPYDLVSSGRRSGFQSLVGTSSIRSYSPGDPLRSIHWKSSARRGELLAFERETAVSRKITIILDAALRGGSGRRFEAAVEAAAGLWLEAKRVDEAAGFLVCGGGNRMKPLTAPGQRGVPHHVFRQLAELSADEDQPGDVMRLAAAQTASGSRLIMVIPQLDEQAAAAVRSTDGRRHRVSVVAVSNEQPGGEERTLKRVLEASGFEVILAPVPDSGEVKPCAFADDAGA